MSAEVGGRLEAVVPRRSLFGPDYARLLVLVLASIGVHAWLVKHTAIPARDSLGYARVALNLANPSPDIDGKPRQRIDIIRTAEQPPGYPATILIVERLLRLVPQTAGLPLSERSLLAAQIANAAAAVLLTIPLYLIGRILFGRNVGFAAAMLFTVLPVPAHMTSDGLSEGVYLLVAATAILLGVRSVRNPSVGGFLLCGLATGASYLVRPEGLGIAICVATVIAWARLRRLWPRDLALGYLAALAAGVGLVGLPYMLLIGKLTNKPTGDTISHPFRQVNPLWQGHHPETKAAPRPAVGGPQLFAEWWDPIRDGWKIHELWALEAIGKELVKSSHYAICGLALFGVFAHRRQLFSPDLGMWLLLVLCALNAALMYYLAERIWYVSSRHTLMSVMLCCVLAGSAFKPLGSLLVGLPYLGRLFMWPQAVPAGLFISIVASTVPFAFQTLHAQREGHKEAGRFLGEHMGPGDDLCDPYAWAEWYSGRTLYHTTMYHGGVTLWVVLEEDCESPHSRLPQLETAKEQAKSGELVFESPKNKAKRSVIRVYKVPPPALQPQESKKP